MMNVFRSIFYNKKILIYGMGKTGLSSYAFLKKNNNLNVYDDDKKVFNTRHLKRIFLNKNQIYQNKFDYIVVSPGINLNNCNLKNYLRKNKTKIVTDLDIFYSHYNKNKIITITGTNGKSTTAKLLNLILKSHKKDSRLCGNIGNPVLLEKKISKKTIFVIEASSYQIDYSKIFKTNYAIILNISSDHLERHGSLKKYIDAKFKLVKKQSNKDIAYINFEDKHLKRAIEKNTVSTKIIKVKSDIMKKFKNKINNPYFSTVGNQQNISFIFYLGKKLNLKHKIIFKILNSFRGLKFRQEIIYKSKKFTFINDSKATSFTSSINILKSLNEVFWIVGGLPKLGDKFNLKKSECKNIKAYIFGKNKKFYAEQIKNKIPFYFFDDLNSALKKILKDLKNNRSNLHKTILFSPAGASFDNFKNFEERGSYFNSLLKKHNFLKIINAN